MKALAVDRLIDSIVKNDRTKIVLFGDGANTNGIPGAATGFPVKTLKRRMVQLGMHIVSVWEFGTSQCCWRCGRGMVHPKTRFVKWEPGVAIAAQTAENTAARMGVRNREVYGVSFCPSCKAFWHRDANPSAAMLLLGALGLSSDHVVEGAALPDPTRRPLAFSTGEDWRSVPLAEEERVIGTQTHEGRALRLHEQLEQMMIGGEANYWRAEAARFRDITEANIVDSADDRKKYGSQFVRWWHLDAERKRLNDMQQQLRSRSDQLGVLYAAIVSLAHENAIQTLDDVRIRDAIVSFSTEAEAMGYPAWRRRMTKAPRGCRLLINACQRL